MSSVFATFLFRQVLCPPQTKVEMTAKELLELPDTHGTLVGNLLVNRDRLATLLMDSIPCMPRVVKSFQPPCPFHILAVMRCKTRNSVIPVVRLQLLSGKRPFRALAASPRITMARLARRPGILPLKLAQSWSAWSLRVGCLRFDCGVKAFHPRKRLYSTEKGRLGISFFISGGVGLSET